ncbi:hypothetical protein Pst134EA_023083 [Puccinia striiformis f. sp. tritici]|uniref:hypothetical protein n=1 Tax=Puccinia striiformis f. sp. tritici TaxID=168172 RepID=UPI002007EE4E|nr:hypothetical protein Pst134EA_023083 [Puccinia striiformis f. sp. tritici]KAH9455623.1 hypothetical protein Pst134EA_023083 [Puccinia striiformis f. sp. tritici]
MIIVFVPALGNGRTDTEKPDISLHSALAELKIRPKMVCRAHDHLDWPSEYAIHLALLDALLLPASQDRHRGVFYGTRGNKLAYLWNLMPINAEETMSMVGQYLRVRTHLFACGPLNSRDTVAENDLKYALQIDQGVSPTPRWTDAICDKIKHNGEKVNGIPTYNGAITYYLSEIPSGELATRIWRHSGTSHILGRVCNWPVRLELLPACSICGAEDHDGARCSYKDLLNQGPQLAIPINNDIMELSPTSIPKKKKKTVWVEPEAPIATHVHHQPSNRGRGTGRPSGPSNRKVESQWADQLQAADPAHKEQTIRKELTFYDVSDSSDSSTPIMSRYNTLKSMSTSKLQPVISYAPVFIRATAMNSPCQSILFTCEPLNVPLDLS